MSVKVIDNFLDEHSHQAIKELLLGDTFFWYYNNAKVITNESVGETHNHQFVHTFYNFYSISTREDYWQTIYPLVDKIKPAALIRIKANLTSCTHVQKRFSFHTDLVRDISGLTAVYYVNSNDGKTVFQDGQEVESVANRFLIFDNKLLHTGTTCTDQKVRCVINLNYIP